MRVKFIPTCLADAPFEVLAVAEHLASALLTSLRTSLDEEFPQLEKRDADDLAQGVFLIAVDRIKREQP